MTLTTVIIATYNHAAFLGEAIRSALAQTAPVEVIVVDDGSTDDTSDVLAEFASNTRVRVLHLDHGGPSRARNAGLDAARGEFVMFLDADDVLLPIKVERQLREFTPAIGWVLSDVQIEDERKRETVKASVRYGYGAMALGGWIQSLLESRNFIPIMSPLVRRSVLEDIRFTDERVPEDWWFWHKVAGVARVLYVPEVLSVYRKKKTGRSRLPAPSRQVFNNITEPLRLNLGCGQRGKDSWHPLEGLVNLDKSLGWCYEDGLGEFGDGSVAGITISHSLMFLPIERWAAVFQELARVLAVGGVLRITEDDALNPHSARCGGWKGSEPAVTLIDAAMVGAHMEAVGLRVADVTPATTHYRDQSLCQAWHGAPPDVFFLEGIRDAGVFFAPHNDDEVLFGSFTILRYRPHVVVCHPGSGDYGDPAVRESETRQAMGLLGAGPVEQWDGQDLVDRMRAFEARVRPVTVWAPHLKTSHHEHRAVALAAAAVFGDRVRSYHTYEVGTEGPAKVRDGQAVAFELEWVQLKLRALLKYVSQITHPRAAQFFLMDLHEYVEGPR